MKDLFYANRVRREALQKSPEEYAKILQVVQYYALDRASRCSFSLSKQGGKRVDVQTDLQMDHVGVTRAIFGDAIASALMPFTVEEAEELGLMSGCRGWATRTTFHGLKAATVIIFLNGRLIEHAALRRAMLQAFAEHLPTSPPAQPFIYLSLRIKGNRVDVNVHPSKRQVFLLDEAEIIKLVIRCLDEQILRRQYQTQAMQTIIIDKNTIGASTARNPRIMNNSTNLYPSQRVLTDAKNSKIDSFLFHSSSQEAPATKWSPILKRPKISEIPGRVVSETIKFEKSPLTMQNDLENIQVNDSFKQQELPSKIKDSDAQVQAAQQEHQPSRALDLVGKDELEALYASSNSQVSRLLSASMVVGVIDSQWSLLQSGTRLVLVDHGRLAGEMFFWKALNWGGGEMMWLDEPCAIEECFEGEAVQQAAKEVIKTAQIVLNAFGVKFEEETWSLKGIPALIPGHRLPPRQNICTFVARLCLLPQLKDVLGVAEELSKLFSSSLDCSKEDWTEYLKHCWLPAFKDSQVRYTLQEGALQIITDTETLYRSFERC